MGSQPELRFEAHPAARLGHPADGLVALVGQVAHSQEGSAVREGAAEAEIDHGKILEKFPLFRPHPRRAVYTGSSPAGDSVHPAADIMARRGRRFAMRHEDGDMIDPPIS